MWRRVRGRLGLAAVVAATVAMRVPALRSDRHIDFDEGVYGVSVLAMRDGFAPFRDVFSSQGPLFLPLLRLFDVAGLHHFLAVRMGMVLAAIAAAVGVYVIVGHLTERAAPALAAAAGLVVATSASGVAASGPIHSDGLALACAVWAVAVALGSGPFGRWRPAVAGLLLGAGMALKSAFLLPAALAVVWPYLRRRQWPQLTMAAGAAMLLGLVVTLPWGFDDVWEQYVRFQLDAPRDREVWPNIANSVARMSRDDSMFLAFVAGGLVALAIRLVRRQVPPGDREARQVVLVWLVATFLFLVLGTELERGSYRFVVFFIAPGMAAFAALRPPPALAAATTVAAIALLPFHLQGADRFLNTQRLTPIHSEVVAALEALPADTFVVTDDPGLAWVAGRYPPPNLVDPSWARIRAGYLGADDVRAGAARGDTCAVLFYSKRFDFLDRGLADSLAGYELVTDWDDGRRLYVKDECR